MLPMLRAVGRFLNDHAVALQTAAAIVSTVAIGWGAFQVYWGRQALDAQATAVALQSSRAILAQIEQNPAAYATLTGVDEGTVAKAAFINSIVSMFSEQFIFWKAGVLPAELWSQFRVDLCDFVMLPSVQPQVVSNIGRGSYPVDFKNELIRCGVKVP
jgi:hypothetical protein